MASTTAKLAGTVSEISGGAYGTIAWGSPNSIKSGTDSTASASIEAASDGTNMGEILTSTGLWLSNFGFSVPSTATIDDVQIKLYYNLDSSAATGSTMLGTASLTKMQMAYQSTPTLIGNSASSFNFVRNNNYAAKTWNQTTDSLGGSLTPTIVNDSTFGVVLAATVSAPYLEDPEKTSYSYLYLDYATVEIFYTDTGGGGGGSSSSSSKGGMFLVF